MPPYSIEQVFDALRLHLKNHLERLECFGKYEFQAEGWLKTEWMTLLEQMRGRGQIIGLDREVVAEGRMKIDLAVDLPDGRHWIELKHWYIGHQKGQRWRPIDFIAELEQECKKFGVVGAGARGWIAALCTLNPGHKEWADAIANFNRVYAPLSLTSSDRPTDYPASYFLGVLKVAGIAPNE
jgi:hypothetical protein